MAKPSQPAFSFVSNTISAAIALVLAAVSLFSCLDTTAKYLVTYSGLPVGQVVWIRFLAQFLLMLVLLPAFGVIGARDMFATNAPRLQWLRSLFMALTTVFNFLALQFLQLDQAISIMFLAPLMVALLAGPVLGEWVGVRRFVAILVGFAGILVVVRPGLIEMGWGVLFSFLSMLALSVFILLTRQLAGRDPTLVTLFYSMFAGVVIGAPYALLFGAWPADVVTWLLLVVMGVFGGFGHYLFILAHARAPASHLSPYLYMQIVPMVLLGFLVFEDLPDLWTAVGALIVVASGVYLVHRERMTRAWQRDS